LRPYGEVLLFCQKYPKAWLHLTTLAGLQNFARSWLPAIHGETLFHFPPPARCAAIGKSWAALSLGYFSLGTQRKVTWARRTLRIKIEFAAMRRKSNQVATRVRAGKD
jgi:hypothetical protein